MFRFAILLFLLGTAPAEPVIVTVTRKLLDHISFKKLPDPFHAAILPRHWVDRPARNMPPKPAINASL